MEDWTGLLLAVNPLYQEKEKEPPIKLMSSSVLDPDIYNYFLNISLNSEPNLNWLRSFAGEWSTIWLPRTKRQPPRLLVPK